MGKSTVEVLHILSRFAKRTFAVMATALCVHVLVMALEYYLVKIPVLSGYQIGFIGMVFSFPMIPIVCAYAVFSVLIYYSWNKMKISIIRTREKEIQEEKQRASMESMRRVAGLLSHYITRYNNDIQMWLAKVKLKDGSVPVTVESASRNISIALGALTEMAFLTEQFIDGGASMDDDELFERILMERMDKLSEERTGSLINDGRKVPVM